MSLLSLPNELLEIIFNNLSPYRDIPTCRVVCKRFYEISESVQKSQKKCFYKALSKGKLHFTQLGNVVHNIPERHHATLCYHNKCLYVFGGSTPYQTQFNDLWKFDLVTNQWQRILCNGTYPVPKSLASLVSYKGKLILYGGCILPTNTLTAPPTFKVVANTHTFDPSTNHWTLHPSCQLGHSGHRATVVGDRMVVFGGYRNFNRGGSTNAVWVLKLGGEEGVVGWKKVVVEGREPAPRALHSQELLDDQHIFIFRGFGEENHHTDAWLLTMSPGELDEGWFWTKLKVNGKVPLPHGLTLSVTFKVQDKLVILGRVFNKSRQRLQERGSARGGPTNPLVQSEAAKNSCTTLPSLVNVEFHVLDLSNVLKAKRAALEYNGEVGVAQNFVKLTPLTPTFALCDTTLVLIGSVLDHQATPHSTPGDLGGCYTQFLSYRPYVF